MTEDESNLTPVERYRRHCKPCPDSKLLIDAGRKSNLGLKHWTFTPCDSLHDEMVGFVDVEFHTIRVSLTTYQQAQDVVGGQIPPAKTGPAVKEWLHRLIIHRPLTESEMVLVKPQVERFMAAVRKRLTLAQVNAKLTA